MMEGEPVMINLLIILSLNKKKMSGKCRNKYTLYKYVVFNVACQPYTRLIPPVTLINLH